MLASSAATPGTPYLCTNLATAELAKVAANSFLATKVSFINAMAEVYEAAGADVVLHLTEWSQYRQLDPVRLRGLVRVPRILDARNVLPLGQWQAAGWAVRSMGATW